MESKQAIMEATLEEFNDKGIKFTMDDIAKRLGMSKKTLYKHFTDKETLFLNTIDYCFSAIKVSESDIFNDKNLSIADKIRRILIVIPERYQHIDWRQVYLAKDKYPGLYAQVEHHLENDWEPTLALLEEGIKQGRIKPIALPVLKIMVESTIEHFLSSDALIKQSISYEAAMDQLVTIIMDGICISQ